QRLLTNAHVVADAHLIHVRRSDGHRKFVASVVCLCFESDLALLAVGDEAFWHGLEPVQFYQGLPRLQSEVCVVGFPDAPSGGETVCVTQGVVSRIDLHSYSWDSSLLVVQIDAAINAGNSGGPCVDQESGLVVGVAFQKSVSSGADNVGYIIPVPVVQHFLECYTTGVWGFGVPGFDWQLLDNPSLRDLVGLPADMTGVLVSTVEVTSPARHLLHPVEDIVLSVDGQEVGEDGTLLLTQPTADGSRPRSLRLKLEWAFRRLPPGTEIRLEVMRQGERREVMLPVSRPSPLVPSDPLDGERLGTRPEYLLVGGLVFVPLTEPYLTEEYGEGWDSCPARLRNIAQHGRMKHAGQQVVLLSDVLACNFTQGYEVYRRLPVERCNGQEVKNLSHLASLVASSETDAFLRFDLAENCVIALKREGISEATAAVMRNNQITDTSHILRRDTAGPE
ncbi:unnamed protein product, partial [Polarella glacialis]